MEELWKTIDWEYFKNYEVSNLGRVKNNKTGNILKPLNLDRYPTVSIRLRENDRKNQSYSIHKLVAIAFILNPANCPQINHKNGIKSDNNVNNLEWVTAKENHTHAEINELSNSMESLKKANDVRLYKPFSQYSLDGDLVATYNNYKEMENATNYKRQCVSKCCNGVYKTSHGYEWRFV